MCCAKDPVADRMHYLFPIPKPNQRYGYTPEVHTFRFHTMIHPLTDSWTKPFLWGHNYRERNLTRTAHLTSSWSAHCQYPYRIEYTRVCYEATLSIYSRYHD